jgi:hypothetical protein
VPLFPTVDTPLDVWVLCFVGVFAVLSIISLSSAWSKNTHSSVISWLWEPSPSFIASVSFCSPPIKTSRGQTISQVCLCTHQCLQVFASWWDVHLRCCHGHGLSRS